MAPLPPVANVFKVDYHWQIGSDALALTRTFWEYSGPAPTSAQMNTWAADFDGDMANLMEPLSHPSVTLIGVKVTDLTSATTPVGEFTGVDTGTRSGSPLGASTSLLCNYTITRRSRGGKPRSYFPFGTASDLNTRQTWTTGFLSAASTGIAAWRTAALARVVGTTTLESQTSIGYYHGFTVVTSPTTGRARNVPKLLATPNNDPVTGFDLNGNVSSQRRRDLIRH